MSAGIFTVPYLMTQSDYESFVAGERKVDFVNDELVLSIEKDGFWVIDEDR